MATAIPKDSIVLVTGATGYIGSHVADQFLEAGYRVRGTTRSVDKAAALEKLWSEKYGSDKVEFVEIKDMAKEGAFDEAVKGVSGIAHVASNMTFHNDPNVVIPGVIAGINNILQSALSSPSVKRFVYTSSSTAATPPLPNKKFHISTSTWNETDVAAAWAPPPYEEGRNWAVYGASKMQAEQALWKFVKEKNPHFVCNAILPNANYGKILSKGQPLTTAAQIVALYNGDITPLKHFPPQWFVDVQDTARLHVAAIIRQDVSNERLFAFSEAFNNNDLLRILRKLRPDRTWPENFVDDNLRDLSTVDNQRGEELLRDMGRKGWTTLEESLANTISDL